MTSVKSFSDRLLFALLVLFALGFFYSALPARAEPDFKGVKPEVIIDVRTPAEFAEGHIKGAINIPVDRIGQDIHSVAGISKNSVILLYCRSGNRSDRARTILLQQGYTQVINGGGLSDVAKVFPSCSYPDC